MQSSTTSFISSLQEITQKNSLSLPVYTYEFLGHDDSTNHTLHKCTCYIPGQKTKFQSETQTSKKKAKEQAAEFAFISLSKDIPISKKRNISLISSNHLEKYSFDKNLEEITHIAVFDLDNLPTTVFTNVSNTCLKKGFLYQFSSNITQQSKFESFCNLQIVEGAHKHSVDVRIVHYVSTMLYQYEQLNHGKHQRVEPHFILISRDKFIYPLKDIIEEHGYPCTMVTTNIDISQIMNL